MTTPAGKDNHTHTDDLSKALALYMYCRNRSFRISPAGDRESFDWSNVLETTRHGTLHFVDDDAKQLSETPKWVCLCDQRRSILLAEVRVGLKTKTLEIVNYRRGPHASDDKSAPSPSDVLCLFLCLALITPPGMLFVMTANAINQVALQKHQPRHETCDTTPKVLTYVLTHAMKASVHEATGTMSWSIAANVKLVKAHAVDLAKMLAVEPPTICPNPKLQAVFKAVGLA